MCGDAIVIIRGEVNSIPECFASHKILPLRRDVISVRKSLWRKFLMAVFRTIANSVATVLRCIPLTHVHYVSIDYFSVSLVVILRWPTTVTAKGNRLRQKQIQCYIFTQRSTPI